MQYTKTIISGLVMETYEYEKAPSTGRAHRVRQEAEQRGPAIPRPRREDNIRRLRRGFIRLVRANLVGKIKPSFLTLTFSSNVGLTEALPIFKRFIRLTASDAGKGFKYIGVPEFQKRGAVHFHVLVWGLREGVVEHERNHRYLQNLWGAGYVDCIPTDASPKLAGYFSKYMQKAMFDDRLIGRRAYYHSSNVLRPVHLQTALPANNIRAREAIFGKQGVLVYQKEFDSEWLGKALYRVISFDPVDIGIDIQKRALKLA